MVQAKPEPGAAPCPKCGAVGAQKVRFTWWGGLLGPRLFHHVRCPSCRAAYNGKTGRFNTTSIVVYMIVVFILAFAAAAALLAGMVLRALAG